MSFFDGLYLVVWFFVLLIVSCTAYFVWNQIWPTVKAGVPATTQTKLETSVDNGMAFVDGSYAAMFIILMLCSVAMTVMLAANPIALIAWLLINIVTLVVFDSLNGFVSAFVAGGVYSGTFANAASFFQTGIPKVIPVFNMLLAIFLFGKRAFSGGSQQ